MGFRRWLTQQLVEYLTQPLPHYERRGRNDLEALKRHIRKADVILVAGDQRVSAVIKVLTQSTWSTREFTLVSLKEPPLLCTRVQHRCRVPRPDELIQDTFPISRITF